MSSREIEVLNRGHVGRVKIACVRRSGGELQVARNCRFRRELVVDETSRH